MSDNRQPDKLDQLLDSGLKQYSSSEPLAGLEDRLLARLEIAAVQADPVRWFDVQKIAWVTAALVLALGIGFGIYLTTGPGEDVDYVAEDPQVINVNAKDPVETAHAPIPLQVPMRNLPPFKAPLVLNIQPSPAPVALKQEVFPAAAPLTEQERLALAFVQRPPTPRPVAPEPGITEIELKPIDVAPLKIGALDNESRDSNSRNTESRK